MFNKLKFGSVIFVALDMQMASVFMKEKSKKITWLTNKKEILSLTPNLGWEDHPNLTWSNNQRQSSNKGAPQNQQAT